MRTGKPVKDTESASKKSRIFSHLSLRMRRQNDTLQFGRIMRKNAVQKMQDGQIKILIRMRAVSPEPCLSVGIF